MTEKEERVMTLQMTDVEISQADAQQAAEEHWEELMKSMADAGLSLIQESDKLKRTYCGAFVTGAGWFRNEQHSRIEQQFLKMLLQQVDDARTHSEN